MKKQILKYTAVFEAAPEGGYTVTVPALPGCISEGDTFEEATAMIEDAIAGYLESLVQHGEPVPRESQVPLVRTVNASLPQERHSRRPEPTR